MDEQPFCGSRAMTLRVNFINPFGTRAYDEIIERTLSHFARPDTELTVTHLDGCPADIDFLYNKHIIEMATYEAVMRSEEDGFDAVIIGCCYDPGVRVARELVDIPVIGPLESSLHMADYHGHRCTVVTDHRKAAPYLRDLVRLYNAESKVTSVRTIDWYVRDMIHDTEAVAEDVIAMSQRVTSEEDDSECIVLACTIIAACYQSRLIAGGAPAEIPVINPNLMALKMAETLGDLHRAGGYQISRRGLYQAPEGHHREEFEKARANYRAAISAWPADEATAVEHAAE